MKDTSHNKRFGKEGEDQAAAYLEKKGYTVLRRNYRFGRVEIDLICRQGTQLVFVEVKSRSSDMMAYPEQAVGKAKQKNIRLAAENFVEENQIIGSVRFDIIALVSGAQPQIEHMEDAFYPFDAL